MTTPSSLDEPSRVDEPGAAQAFSDVLTQVASGGRPVIVRRNGEDLAAVVPLQLLDLLRELRAQQEVERLAAQINWEQVRKTLRPPQEWFEGEEPKPF